MSTVTVTWKAFADLPEARKKDLIDAGRKMEVSKTIEVPDTLTLGVSHSHLCEMLFRDTNLYEGQLWDLLQPLPEGRTHTAMSVGDLVQIDDVLYRCEDIGFEEVS